MKTQLIFGIIAVAAISSCSKDKTPDTEASSIDAEMLELAQSYKDSIFFANVDSLFQKSSGSGHPQPYLKVKYNSIAGSVIDQDGRVMANASFPEGSLIIKELYTDSNTIGRYAMLYKLSDHPSADSKGWVWGYVDPGGNVAVPASDMGNACINCHSQSGNIDYTLMNKYYP